MPKTMNNKHFFITMFSLLIMTYVLPYRMIHEMGYVGIDSFYHIAMSKYKVFEKNIVWLPHTIFGDKPIGKHFLYQKAMYPFILISLQWGPIIYNLFFILLLFFLLFKIFYKYNDCLILLSLIFWGSTIEINRFMQIRPIPASLLFLLLYYYAIVNKKLLIILIISTVFTLFYSAYFAILLILIPYLISGESEKKSEIKVVALTLLGIILGNVFNPSFPDKIGSELEFIYLKFFFGSSSEYIPIEWLPLPPLEYLTNFWAFWILLIYMVSYVIVYKINIIPLLKNENIKIILFNLLIYSILFLFYRRFVDFWQLFFVLFMVELSYYILGNIERLQDLKDFYCSLKVVNIFVIVACVINVLLQLSASDRIFINGNRLKNSADYLFNNTKFGDLIVLSNINTFPEYVYHNPNNSFLVGMDWQFLKYYNRQLSMAYYNLMNGEYGEPSVFLEKVGSKYLFIDSKYANIKLLKLCNKDKNLTLIYEDNVSYIFKINKTDNDQSSS